jgi:hypothetical protein
MKGRRIHHKAGAKWKGSYVKVPADLMVQLEGFVKTRTNSSGRRVFHSVSEAVTEALTSFLEKHKTLTHSGPKKPPVGAER